MTVYIDADFKCYTEAGEGRTSIETDFFDEKCAAFVEGYRFVPEGETWVREDGAAFTGEMVAPWRDSRELEAFQSGYDAALAAIEEALNE